MSISEKIDQLREHIDEDGLDLLKELGALVMPYEPEVHFKRLRDALGGRTHRDQLHDLVDALHASTARYFKPHLDRFDTYRVDLDNFFGNCHAFIDGNSLDALSAYLDLYYRLFAEPKKICGLPRVTCHTPDCEGRFAKDQLYCQECGAYRALCRNPAASNGRCTKTRGHGGKSISGPLHERTKKLGRAALYRKSLSGELERMYVEALTDKDYISVAPEMAALASRTGELMGQLGDADYVAVSAQVKSAIRRLNKAKAEGDVHAIDTEVGTIDGLLTGVVDDKRRWDEIAALSGRLGRLAEAERKRLIEAQKMITVQEMFMLQQETLTQIRDAAGVVATEIVELVQGNQELNVRQVKHLILTTLHSVTKGDVRVDYYLDKGEKLDSIVLDGELIGD